MPTKRDFVPGVTDQGPPRPAPAYFPYNHGTLADQQEAKRAKWREKYAQERKSLRRPLQTRRAG